jgi:hypothetical protein
MADGELFFHLPGAPSGVGDLFAQRTRGAGGKAVPAGEAIGGQKRFLHGRSDDGLESPVDKPQSGDIQNLLTGPNASAAANALVGIIPDERVAVIDFIPAYRSQIGKMRNLIFHRVFSKETVVNRIAPALQAARGFGLGLVFSQPPLHFLKIVLAVHHRKDRYGLPRPLGK